MGIMDRIKKVTGTQDAYDESYEEDYYDGFDGGYDDGGADGDMQYGNTQIAGGKMNAQMGGMNTVGQTGGISLSGSNIKMQVVRPRTYDSETASQIADHLLNKCTVVLNLENTNKEASLRLIDFLTGVAYSIGGSLKKIATSAYVITPSNVDVGESPFKTKRAPEPQPEEKEVVNDDFTDFNN